MMFYKVLRVTVLACLVNGLVSSTALAQHYNLYHFDDPAPIELNLNRIAVFAGTQDPIAVESLADLGITLPTVESFPIPGWQLLNIELDDADGSSLEDAINRIARKAPFDFVAPVFFDDFGGPLIPTRDILVRFNPNIEGELQDQILAEMNVGTILDRDWANMPGAYRIRSHSNNGLVVLEQANTLARRPEVRWAEPDMIFTSRSHHIPNDPGFSNCWGLHNTGQSGGTPDMDMDVPEAWDITLGDPNIIILIMDNGVQQNHPDIHQIAGSDFTEQGGGGGPVNECDNHGTPVAGCVSATIDNNLGTVGVAPNCRIASARVSISNVPCDGAGILQFSWVVNSLAWAEDIGVRVTNNSNSYGSTSFAIEDKYDQTRNNGMIHFASAGNESSSSISYPASLSTVNAIAALNEDGNLTSFSNYGNGLAFSAPGIDIYTTDRTGSAGWAGGDYVYAWGTSFASPYVAGVAALFLSQNPSLSAVGVEDTIANSCMDLGQSGYDLIFGWGFVNANDGLQSVRFEDIKLLASDGAVGDWLGFSVAISGETAVVGAYLDDDNGSGSGSAYLFDTTTGQQITKLLPNDGAAGDIFGRSVAISGATAIVGADGDDDNGSNSGSAYLFDITTGQQITKLLPDDGTDAEGDRFGRSVAISGDPGMEVAIVGAYLYDDKVNGASSGSAYLFDVSDPANPEQISKLLADDGAAGDWFGFSVAINGATAIVGTWRDNENGAFSGSAYIFDTTTGRQLFKLLPNDGTAGDRFGYSVAISPDSIGIAIIGANRDGDNGTGSGSAYLFDIATGTQIVKLLPDDGALGDEFGWSVGISGSPGEEMAIVGAYVKDDNGDSSGSAYLFDISDPMNPAQIVKLLPNGGAALDNFGTSVAISGTTAIVGADGDDDNGDHSGSAYVYVNQDDPDNTGDLDGDGIVTIIDLLILLGNWGPCGDCNNCPADLDGDCSVNTSDLLILFANWG